MKQSLNIGIVVVFLAAAIGVLVFLSSQKPPEETAHASSQVVKIEQDNHQIAQRRAEAEKELQSLSPNLAQINPHDFVAPVPVGQKAPDFEAMSANGFKVKLSDYLGKKNVVMVFYQGNFCSVCGAQLSNLQKHIADFKAQDAEILAISADDIPHAQMTLGERGLSFPIIPDYDKDIIQKFGVPNITKNNIAWPSAFIVDKKGIVRLSYADEHGHRLHSGEFLEELSKITGKPAPKLSYNE